MGFYVLLSDDTESGYESHRNWYPKLHKYMQEGANVLFFTFIHPETMEVPPAFANLAKTRGTNEPGAVPKDTVILFALGRPFTNSKILQNEYIFMFVMHIELLLFDFLNLNRRWLCLFCESKPMALANIKGRSRGYGRKSSRVA